MTDPKQRWQHITPQDSREMHEEEVSPVNAAAAKPRCATCNKPIAKVDENEGPEALKALFRF